MKKIILLFMLVFCISIYAKDNYEIETFEKDYNEKLLFSKFHLVYYMYFDMLLPLDARDSIDLESKKKIFKELYDNLSNSYQQQLSIKTGKPENLIIRLKPYKMKNDISLIVYTNYDVEKKQLVPIDSSPDNFYATQYFIVDNKLVPGKLFYDRENDAKIIQSLKNNALADFILYDSKSSNDSEVPGIVKNGLTQDIPLKDKCIMKLTLCEYYLMQNKFSDFDALCGDINADINGLADEKDKKFIQSVVEILTEIKNIIK